MRITSHPLKLDRILIYKNICYIVVLNIFKFCWSSNNLIKIYIGMSLLGSVHVPVDISSWQKN